MQTARSDDKSEICCASKQRINEWIGVCYRIATSADEPKIATRPRSSRIRDQKLESCDATLPLHAGAGYREIAASASSPSVMATSFFTHQDALGFSATDFNEAAQHLYTRWSNPTLELLEACLAALEGGEAALLRQRHGSDQCPIPDRLSSGDQLGPNN